MPGVEVGGGAAFITDERSAGVNVRPVLCVLCKQSQHPIGDVVQDLPVPICKICAARATGKAHTPGRPGDPRFYRLLDEIANLHAKKSQDYSPGADPLANFRAAADFGLRPYHGLLCRIADKWRRVMTFSRTGTLQNESARDSHIDSAVYHLIAVLLLEDEAQAPLSSDTH